MKTSSKEITGHVRVGEERNPKTSYVPRRVQWLSDFTARVSLPSGKTSTLFEIRVVGIGALGEIFIGGELYGSPLSLKEAKETIIRLAHNLPPLFAVPSILLWEAAMLYLPLRSAFADPWVDNWKTLAEDVTQIVNKIPTDVLPEEMNLSMGAHYEELPQAKGRKSGPRIWKRRGRKLKLHVKTKNKKKKILMQTWEEFAEANLGLDDYGMTDDECTYVFDVKSCGTACKSE